MFQYHKAGQTEFNWILILIAGIVILSSFTAFAFSYKRLSDRRINTELSLALTSQLDSLTTPGLTTIIDPEGLNFLTARFSCNSMLLNSGVPIPIDDNIIFSSSSIDTDKLLLWVSEFSLPYRISNIVYISSPYIKYYILYDDESFQVANALYSSIPKNKHGNPFFNVKLTNELLEESIKEDIKNENLREIRIAAFEDIEIPRFNIKTRVIRLSNSLTLGDIYYLDTNEINKYIKKELMLASIFSDNYQCNQDKLIRKLENINSIYLDKASKLFFKTQTSSKNCNYQLFVSTLSSSDIFDLESLPSLETKLLAQNLEFSKKGCQDVF